MYYDRYNGYCGYDYRNYYYDYRNPYYAYGSSYVNPYLGYGPIYGFNPYFISAPTSYYWC